jgi:hypothetical protein
MGEGATIPSPRFPCLCGEYPVSEIPMNPPPLFVFDIETVPDPIAGGRLLRMEGASRAEIAEALRAYHLERSNGTNDFLRQPFWEVVAISYAYVDVEGRPAPRTHDERRPDLSLSAAVLKDRRWTGVSTRPPLCGGYRGGARRGNCVSLKASRSPPAGSLTSKPRPRYRFVRCTTNRRGAQRRGGMATVDGPWAAHRYTAQKPYYRSSPRPRRNGPR